MGQGALGSVVPSGEKGRAGLPKAWAPGSPLFTTRSDCDPVTRLSGPSFSHSEVEELAQVISEVRAKSKILRFPL